MISLPGDENGGLLCRQEFPYFICMLLYLMLYIPFLSLQITPFVKYTEQMYPNHHRERETAFVLPDPGKQHNTVYKHLDLEIVSIHPYSKSPCQHSGSHR